MGTNPGALFHDPPPIKSPGRKLETSPERVAVGREARHLGVVRGDAAVEEEEVECSRAGGAGDFGVASVLPFPAVSDTRADAGVSTKDWEEGTTLDDTSSSS